MTIHQLRQIIRPYYTLYNIVLAVAALMAITWIWSTMETLQNNFRLQGQLDTLKSQVEINKLQAESLELENHYFASDEYLELQARNRLGKAAPGEHMLILPANTVRDTLGEKDLLQTSPAEPSNFQAWLNFFFGNRKNS